MRSRMAARNRARMLVLLAIDLTTHDSLFPLPAGERVRVRGDRSYRGNDTFQYTVDIAKNVIVPEAKDEVALRFENRRPLRILLRPRAVLPAIQFDNQTRGFTAKINNVRCNRHLPPEFQSIQATVAQAEPQRALGIGLIPPQSSRYGDTRHHNPSPARAARGHPLPMGEGSRIGRP